VRLAKIMGDEETLNKSALMAIRHGFPTLTGCA